LRTQCSQLRFIVAYFIQQESFKGTLVRELEHIGGNKELVIHAGEGVLYHLFSFAGAEQNTDGRIVTFMHLVLFIIGHIGIELTKMLMMELIVLQFHDNATMQDAVIEHQIRIVVFVINDNSFLSGLETKALAKLQQEIRR